MSNVPAQTNPRTAIFLTYNTVGKDGKYSNGSVLQGSNEAVVVQHPRGETWGAYGRADEKVAGNTCRGLIHSVYGSALRQAQEFDLIVVYVGDRGSEGAIRLVSDQKPSRVHFVLCDCNLGRKQEMIKAAGLSRSRYTLCECGGHATMERLLIEFLDKGFLSPCRRTTSVDEFDRNLNAAINRAADQMRNTGLAPRMRSSYYN